MTPLTSYIIYYGLEPLGEELSLSEVVPVIDGGVVSGYTVTGVTLGGEVRVGVAAVNSAGASQVVYHQQAVGESHVLKRLSANQQPLLHKRLPIASN